MPKNPLPLYQRCTSVIYTMNVGQFVVESAAFTRETLLGKPTRWLVFILLGIPWMVLLSRAESQKILEGTTVHWGQIPWGEAGLLIGAGFLCNFLMSGYIVRLLKDDPLPPEFDHPFLLCLDGMKLQVIPLVWMLVPSVLIYVQYSLASGGPWFNSPWEPTVKSALILVLLVLEIIIVFIAVQHVMIGAIRFARTGSVREGFNQLAIRATISRIGIVNYFAGIGIITLIWLLFSLLLRGVALLPLAGPGISLILAPVPTIYCFRFIAHFCDEDRLTAEEKPGTAGDMPAPGLSPRGLLLEYLFWLALLAVLVVLCFTPLALVVGSVTGFFL
jgi:hypothetical protein